MKEFRRRERNFSRLANLTMQPATQAQSQLQSPLSIDVVSESSDDMSALARELQEMEALEEDDWDPDTKPEEDLSRLVQPSNPTRALEAALIPAWQKIEPDEIVQILNDERATDIFAIDTTRKCSWTSCMVIASGKSLRHVRAVASRLLIKFRHRIKASGSKAFVEGGSQDEWLAINTGSIVVHLMTPEARVNYDLERLWALKHDFGLSAVAEDEGIQFFFDEQAKKSAKQR